MPRPGLTYDEVTTAANRVLETGKKPTINRVREALGGRGSSTTISRYLKDWKRDLQEGGVAASADEMISPLASAAADAMEASFAIPPSRPASNVKPLQIEPVAERPISGLKPSDYQSSIFMTDEYRSEAPALINPRLAPVEGESELDTLKREHEALKIQCRRLHSEVNKERVRRQAFEMLAREAKEYVNIIKEQVGQRILDLRMASDHTVNQLKANSRREKQDLEQELKCYREELLRIQKEFGKQVSNLTPNRARRD